MNYFPQRVREKERGGGGREREGKSKFLDDESYVTCMFDGDFPTTQCVAVRTHSGLINEPPQNCRPSRVRSNACQGQELMIATVPPTISVEIIGRSPQTAAI